TGIRPLVQDLVEGPVPDARMIYEQSALAPGERRHSRPGDTAQLLLHCDELTARITLLLKPVAVDETQCIVIRILDDRLLEFWILDRGVRLRAVHEAFGLRRVDGNSEPGLGHPHGRV